VTRCFFGKNIQQNWIHFQTRLLSRRLRIGCS